MTRQIKCIFCDWETATRKEKDECKWKPCDDCRSFIKSGMFRKGDEV